MGIGPPVGEARTREFGRGKCKNIERLNIASISLQFTPPHEFRRNEDLEKVFNIISDRNLPGNFTRNGFPDNVPCFHFFKS